MYGLFYFGWIDGVSWKVSIFFFNIFYYWLNKYLGSFVFRKKKIRIWNWSHPACFFNCGRKPTQTWGENENSTQKAFRLTVSHPESFSYKPAVLTTKPSCCIFFLYCFPLNNFLYSIIMSWSCTWEMQPVIKPPLHLLSSWRQCIAMAFLCGKTSI